MAVINLWDIFSVFNWCERLPIFLEEAIPNVIIIRLDFIHCSFEHLPYFDPIFHVVEGTIINAGTQLPYPALISVECWIVRSEASLQALLRQVVDAGLEYHWRFLLRP